MKLFIIRHGESFNNWLYDQASREDYNQKRVADPPLTELGERQAQAVADHLANAQVAEHFRTPPADIPEHFRTISSEEAPGYGITRLYCSAMLRSMQTIWPIGQALGIAPEVLIDIHESGGLFTNDPTNKEDITNEPGLTRSEMENQFPEYVLPETITEEGWWYGGQEDISHCCARAIRMATMFRRWSQEFAQQNRQESIAIVSHGDFMSMLIKAFLDQLPSPQIAYIHYNTGITRIDFPMDNRAYVRYFNRTDHFSAELYGHRAEPHELSNALPIP